MAQSPKVYSPQCDFHLSDAVKELEIREAEFEHREANYTKDITRLTSDKAYWKEEAGKLGEELRVLHAENALAAPPA